MGVSSAKAEAAGLDDDQVREVVQREIRGTLFDGCFRTAVTRGLVDAVDREMWRELFIENPDAFDFLIAHEWRAAA